MAGVKKNQISKISWLLIILILSAISFFTSYTGLTRLVMDTTTDEAPKQFLFILVFVIQFILVIHA